MNSNIWIKGFKGVQCDEKIDVCSLGLNGAPACLNNATCVNRLNNQNSSSDYLCICSPGFTGSRCESFKDPCASHPCPLGGTCVNLSDTVYQCMSNKQMTCPEGFYGLNCQLDINECATNSTYLCHNNSTCINTFGSFLCQCLTGFTGARCELRLDNCYSNPCKNSALCLNDAESSFKCVCQTGYSGVLCENLIDACQSLPCLNQGLLNVTRSTNISSNFQ